MTQRQRLGEECQGYHQLKEERGSLSQGFQRVHGPADTSILHFQPLELRHETSLLFKPPACGTLSQQF